MTHAKRVNMNRTGAVTIGFLTLAITAAPAAEPPSRQTGPLEAAAFIAGCWRGAAGPDRTIEEIYWPPSGNLMQGMTRFVRGGTTIDYEFSLIDVEGQRSRLRPHPRGQASGAFLQSEAGPGRIVWEDPTHDFPQRISYTAAPGDSLIARIEGPSSSGPRSIEWRMGRVPCPGS
jgi:hypothetical protein